MKKLVFSSISIVLSFLASGQAIQDNFEGTGNITTWFGDDCGLEQPFTNPFQTGINQSSKVLKYNDIGGQYANVRFDATSNFNLSANYAFTLKIYVPASGLTGSQPLQISLKLQNGNLGAPWSTQSEIIKPIVVNQWQEVTFNFANDPYINLDPTSLPPINRTDFNRVLLQVNGENNNSKVLAYIDDFYYLGAALPPPVVFDQLVWNDEFDTNGAVDGTKWFHQTQLPAGGSWYNGEIQHYTNRVDNSVVTNGFLNIIAKKETYQNQGVTKSFTSARLNSKFAFKYGRVEVRAKLPSGVGTWPAIWTLGKNVNEDGAYWDLQGFGTANWPACGEIDIMEHWGSNQNYVQSAMHTPSSYGGTFNLGGQTIATASSAYHIYTLVWTAEKMEFAVDGVIHYTYNPSVKNASTWPFDAEQYLLLNLAIQSNISSSFTQGAMEVDYVRVYKNSTVDSQAPTNLTATVGAITGSSVELLLNATDNSGNVTYNVAYGSGASTIFGTSGVQKSLIVANLSPNTNYTFTVTATDAAGNTAINNPILVTATTSLVPNDNQPTTSAPVPTKLATDVKSVFSDTYTNISTVELFPYWEQGTKYVNYTIPASSPVNNVIKYSNLDYQGINITAAGNSPGEDFSAMTTLHIDVWTPDVASFKLFPIDNNTDLLFKTLTPTKSGWNSYDIVLATDFPTLNKASIRQFKFEKTAFVYKVETNTIYFDNIYFWKAPAAGPTASSQTFCGIATVSSIVATGTALKWYDVSVGGNALSSSTALTTKTYYVSQTLVGIESTRTAVSVIITPLTTTGSVTTSICAGESYTWPANGVTYTTAQSGISVVSGCNTATLNLSITPLTTIGSETVSACGSSYTWPTSGVDYTSSGTYTYVVGCNTATLNLTLTPKPTTVVTNETICSGASYTWAANGQVYTATQTALTITSDGCTADQVLNLTVTPKPATVVTNETICSGESYNWSADSTNYTTTQTVTITNDGCTADQVLNLTVTPAANAGTNGTLSLSASPSDATLFAALTGADTGGSWTRPSSGYVGVYTYTVNATAPCTGNDTSIVTVSSASQIPAGPLSFCTGATVATVTAGTTLKFYDGLTGGTFKAPTTALTSKTWYVTEVLLSTGLESTTRTALVITVNALPATPVTITGTAAICNVVGSTTELTYSIAAVTGATSYVWTVPTGANIVSGQGTTSVVVNFAGVAQGITALTLGVRSVNASSCLSVAKTLSLTRVLPVAPASVVLTNPASATPATAITAVGPFIGTITELTLTAAVTASANSYSWTLPAGVNVVSGNPATDRVLVINFANAASGITSITASVVSVSGCGNSIAKALVLTKVLPAKPAAITTKQANVCLIAGSSTNVTYTVAPVVGAFANGYTWTVPTGASIVGSASGASIVVSYSSNFNAAGSVTVTSSNGVGTSATAATLAVAVTAPAVPATLVMTLAPSTTAVVAAGPYMATSTELTLTAAAVAGAVSYAWTLPAGVNQVSGGTERIITVNFADVVTPTGITALPISVKAVNGCGLQSAAKALSLTRALPVKPAAITTTLANVCSIAGTNATVTYSVAPVAGAFANGYTWTVPTGGTIVTGQGSTSIAVSYAGDFTAGNVSVSSSNGVGTSLTPTTLAVARTSGSVAPAALVGQVAGLCAGTAYNYSFAAGANAQRYTITGPVGSVVTSADNASNTSNVITTSNLAFTVVYPTTAIVNISIVASNPCGSAAAKLFVVSKVMRAITTISGPTAVDTCSDYTYTATPVVGAVAYTWTIPSGAEIVSGQGTNTLVVKFPGTLATGAVLKVLATNACSVSSALKSSSVLTRTTCQTGLTGTARLAAKSVTDEFNVIAYPNPTSDVFTLEVQSSGKGKATTEVQVYDMAGRLIEKLQIQSGPTQLGANYPSGTYILNVSQGENLKTLRLSKR